jgi:xanthine dehydrogenase accessory factor
VSVSVSRLQTRLDSCVETLPARVAHDDTDAVLATIVTTNGSTYRKAGARMLILANGKNRGLLSGGCLEADLRLHAEGVLRSGVALAVEYDMRGPDDALFGVGAGCVGALRILLESARPSTPAAASLAASYSATRAGRPIPLIVLHDAPRFLLGTYTIAQSPHGDFATMAQQSLAMTQSQDCQVNINGWETRAFVQYLAPAPHLLICGAGPDVPAVARNAVALGWRVSIVDHRPSYLDPGDFPGAEVILGRPGNLGSLVDLKGCHAAVVMSHHFPSDALYLSELAQTLEPGYVGLLGPAARRERLVAELGTLWESLENRIHGPVGLPIGAQSPEGIALSIVAQIHAWLAQRQALGSGISSLEKPRCLPRSSA